ncbi:MAG: LapA family protein [Isosphaeraceae bacterium]
MRVIHALLLLILLGALGVFAVENTQPITARFWNWSVTLPVAALCVAVYLLGMVSGWNVVGFFRRSLHGVSASSRYD